MDRLHIYSFVSRQRSAALTPSPMLSRAMQLHFSRRSAHKILQYTVPLTKLHTTRRCAIAQRKDYRYCFIYIYILYAVVQTRVTLSCMYKFCAAYCVLSRVLSISDVVFIWRDSVLCEEVLVERRVMRRIIRLNTLLVFWKLPYPDTISIIQL